MPTPECPRPPQGGAAGSCLHLCVSCRRCVMNTSHPVRRWFAGLIALLLLGLAAGAWAAVTRTSEGLAAGRGSLPDHIPAATHEDAQIQALVRARNAVLGVRTRATDGARSIDTLGRERIGSGVVIGNDGLVLT